MAESNVGAESARVTLEHHAEAILRAAGSSLRNYELNGTRERILAAVENAMTAPPTGQKDAPPSVLVERAVIWFMEELQTAQRLLLLGRLGMVIGERDYYEQAEGFRKFLDGEYMAGRHDGANAEQKRIVAWMHERADYLERVGSSFDHYDAGCLRREAGAIESGEHLP